MFEGTVISINIAPEAAAPMQSVSEVRAVPGRGLEGDRYFDQKGTFSKPQPDRELTLIEAEAVEAMKGELSVDYGLSDSRRNVVTRGVLLNHLVGRILGWRRESPRPEVVRAMLAFAKTFARKSPAGLSASRRLARPDSE